MHSGDGRGTGPPPEQDPDPAPAPRSESDPRSDPDPPLGTPWVRPTRHWWSFLLVALLPPLLAFGLVRATFAAGRDGSFQIDQITSGITDMSGDSWGRWDSGNYADIAEHGYYWSSCASQNRPTHGDICSPAAWYPAYPYLSRWVNDLTGWTLDQSLAAVAQLAFLALLYLVWIGYLRARLTPKHVMLLVFTVFFPGAVYLLADFPISLLCAMLAAQFLCFTRSRWILGAVFGALASICYPIAIILPFTSVIWVAVALWHAPRRELVVKAASVGAIVASGTLAVFTMHQIVLGDWAASIKEQQKFGGALYNPAFQWFHTVVKQNSWIQTEYPKTARPVAAQTVLVTLIVIACVAVVVFVKKARTPHDVGLLVMLIAFWLLPLSGNIDTGLYRKVGPLVPAAVLLLRRAPWPVTAALTVLSIGVWWKMLPIFYDGNLI